MTDADMSERLGDDTTVPAPPRRRVDATHRALAVAVAVFALLVLATTIVASWNPWRYVVLFPLGRPLGALCGYAGAVGLLGSAGLLGLAGVGRRVIASLAVATFVSAWCPCCCHGGGSTRRRTRGAQGSARLRCVT